MKGHLCVWKLEPAFPRLHCSSTHRHSATYPTIAPRPGHNSHTALPLTLRTPPLLTSSHFYHLVTVGLLSRYLIDQIGFGSGPNGFHTWMLAVHLQWPPAFPGYCAPWEFCQPLASFFQNCHSENRGSHLLSPPVLFQTSLVPEPPH